MRKIAVIGAGGINSWAIQFLKEVLDVFDENDSSYVKIFDEDIVEEKNLLRKNQNFTTEDLMELKCEVLAKRYSFDNENVFITEKNIDKIKQFDYVIMGVDNHKTRKIVYEYCLTNGIELLDLRAQGTRMSYFVVDHTKKMDYYTQKFFSNPIVMEKKGGCQLKVDIQNDHIENGNQIIAMWGIKGIFLKLIRKEKLATHEFETVY